MYIEMCKNEAAEMSFFTEVFHVIIHILFSKKTRSDVTCIEVLIFTFQTT